MANPQLFFWCNIQRKHKIPIFPEFPHPPYWCPDDGLHSGDDQHWKSGVQCQAFFQLQCLQGTAFWPGGCDGLLDKQGKSLAFPLNVFAFLYLCWRVVSMSLQVNIKMKEIMEKELKMKHHLLESPSHQKVALHVSVLFPCLTDINLSFLRDSVSCVHCPSFTHLHQFLTGSINCQMYFTVFFVIANNYWSILKPLFQNSS